LLGNTKGYKNHPQLKRFKNAKNPIGAIASYLRCVSDEADKRGYNFKRNKIVKYKNKSKLLVTSGQVEYEFKHLLGKLKERDPDLYKQLKMVNRIKVHPIFKKVSGNIEDWEII
ncbi:MAG: DNA lyase, partial [Candidatus Dadabacteria bacterium]|nr:DNA lyase [Candidatus Dadabacteria bacterium]